MVNQAETGAAQAPRVPPVPGRAGLLRRAGAAFTGGLDRNFWLMWTGWTISSAGNGLTDTALPLLAADLTTNPSAVSLVSFADRLPWLVLALTGGALSDRWDRRKSLWISDAVRFVMLVGLFTAVLLDWDSIALLMVVAFAVTAIETLYDSSRASILPMLVTQDRERLELANRRLMSANTAALKFAGPAAGGLLYAAARALPSLVDAVSFGLSAITSFLMRGDFTGDAAGSARKQRPPMRREIAEGVRWLARHRVLRVFTLVAGLKNMCTAGQLALLVLYTRQIMHIGDVGYGLLLSSVAVGSVLAGFTCRLFTERLGPARSSLGGSVFGAAGFAILGFTHNTALVALGLAVTGYTSMTWNVTTVSLRQAMVPRHLAGRTSGVNRLVTFGLMPIGVLISGQIATHFGLNLVYSGEGVFGVSVAVIGLLSLSNSAVEEALREAQALQETQPA
ncbi:MFS transporter [Streptacidiphilus sp. P02-A3a]|uniref:MFS transporter n=1 Tax=Streptacidiphilus sp. P02-A3a TaxID=2704468 RepID=UPI0015FABBAE|nr:MFS transporter [Streptacidiphilus sp. P02-A3a]QMU73406.1 MFS transporter [Streptacidiphilus sp. P02-A3a]